MITLILLLSESVNGAGMLLAAFLLTALMYFLINLCFERNRTKNGIIRVSVFLVLCELISDIIFYSVYFTDGEDSNPGIAGLGVLLIYPALLILAAMIINLKKKNGA